jgi:hypothetical protein
VRDVEALGHERGHIDPAVGEEPQRVRPHAG